MGLPLFLLVALAIKLDSKGTVIYRSTRFGRSAVEFPMFKFRSMSADADAQLASLASRNERTGPLFKISDDPRITRVGRFLRATSIDELPQLVNVLRGEMSLVGPRPATIDEERAFTGDHRRRFRVRPGITGLWQVEARTHPSFNAYRRLDLHYLENWTLGLDLMILLTTALDFLIAILTAPLARLGLLTNADSVVIDLGQGSAKTPAATIDLTDLQDPLPFEPAQDLAATVTAPAARTAARGPRSGEDRAS